MSERHTVLIIDDEKIVLESNKLFLSSNGFNVVTALGGNAGIEKVKESPYSFAVVLLDFHMPQKNGLETLKELLVINPELLIVMFSGDDSWEVHSSTVGIGGAYTFIPKDISSNRLLNVIKGLCSKFEQNRKKVVVKFTPIGNELIINQAGLIGRSQALFDIVELAKRCSQSDATVLISGETGVGKGVIAQCIHNQSKRNSKQFVSLNCANFSATLLESELFGHVKGSFTGADRDKKGILESAAGGTVFLDEVGEIPLEIQSKILTFLQDRTIRAVGGTKTMKLDVRVIAASNIDFNKAMNEGKFRSDLYYRLNVLGIEVPPLRNRKEDIEPLVAFFTNRFNKENNTNKYFLAPALLYMEMLSWNGNVRELEHFVLRQLQLIDKDLISMSDLLDIEGKRISDKEVIRESNNLDHLMSLHEQSQREYVLSRMSEYKSLRHAAKTEDVSYATFRRLVNKLGLSKMFLKLN